MNRFLDNCKSLQKRAKKGPKNADLGYFLHFLNFWSIFVNFEPKQNSKLQNKILIFLKNWAQKCLF